MADTRRAVRELLRAQFPDALAALTRMPGCAGGTGYEVPADAPLVLVALSGGADSLALAAATAFEAQRCGLHAGAVIVDHQLQEGSADVAAAAAAEATKLGLAPVIIERVVVGDSSLVEPVETTKSNGPEADARAARYDAFARALEATGAQAILLAHTLNDQAETVLLGLARGAGATSISGMTPVTADFDKLKQRLLRPFLTITRAQTEQACADQGLEPWHDPHNTDRGYARVRIRHDVLPVLETELGPGIAESLARTASHLQDDAEVLDALAKQAWCETWTDTGIGAKQLHTQPRAIRTRVLKAAAERAGLGSLTSAHIDAIDLLMTNWHGQGSLDVPGGTVARVDDILIFSAE